METHEYLHWFLDAVAAGRMDATSSTLHWYEKRLRVFSTWTSLHYADCPLSKPAFNGFIAHLKAAGYSLATVRGYVVILRRLGRWLHREGYAPDNPAADLRLPPKSKRVPKHIPTEDIEKLLAVAVQPRDRALLLLLKQSGARAAELLGLQWGHLDLAGRQALVLGKGQKERFVFFRADAQAALMVYRETVPHAPTDPVWWSLRERDRPLTYWGLYQLLARLGAQAGVEKCNPHAFRHAFGRQAARNGCPTLVLQDLMGHASPETTKLYTFLDEQDLAALHAQYAP